MSEFSTLSFVLRRRIAWILKIWDNPDRSHKRLIDKFKNERILTSDPFFNFIMDMTTPHPFHSEKVDESPPHSIPGCVL